MHKKYSKDGLAAVSVALDDLSEKGTKDKLVKFLNQHKATFTNLLLDEPAEVWQEKLKIIAAPCVFVFNRDGSIAKKFIDEVKHEDVEKLVDELMKKK